MNITRVAKPFKLCVSTLTLAVIFALSMCAYLDNTPVAVSSGPTLDRVCVEANNYCAPKPDAKVVASIEARGLDCSTESYLAPVVVFTLNTNMETVVVSFDKAMKLAQDELGWVQLWCS